MSLWAIIPVKPLRRGKSRLAGVLSDEERSKLNINLFENTIRSLMSVSQIEQILVISRDTSALSLARDYGVRTVQEDNNSELNMALERATAVVKKYGGTSLLILPADLPLITSEEICGILSQARQPPEIVIVPDRREDGTNALYINPAGAIEYCYGCGSFLKYIEQAKIKNINVKVVHSDKIELDLDIPEDLEIFQRKFVN